MSTVMDDGGLLDRVIKRLGEKETHNQWETTELIIFLRLMEELKQYREREVKILKGIQEFVTINGLCITKETP